MNKFFKILFNYFLQGLAFFAPIFITFYIGYIVFINIDEFTRSIINKLFNINLPGIGILFLFFLIAFLGFLTNTFIFNPIGTLFERMLNKAPLIKFVYSSLKDLTKVFVGEEKKFNKPVLVKINPAANIEKIGFLTQDDLKELNLKDKVAVYFPHSYNFSGELFIVPTEHVKPLDIPASMAMKFIVSGGISYID